MRYLLISILTLMISFLGFLRPLEVGATFLLDPLQKVSRSLGLEVRSCAEFLGNITSLYADNQRLKEELLHLQSRLVDARLSYEEAEALKAHFVGLGWILPADLSPTSESSTALDSLSHKPSSSTAGFVSAMVVGNAADPTQATLYIDRGEVQGISSGDPVLYGNNLVGRVLAVSARRSLIGLLYSPEVMVAVRRASSDISPPSTDAPASLSPPSLPSPLSTEGLVTGNFGTGLRLERVLQSEVLQPGDIFITTGREGIFPPGLLVGQVVEVYEEPTEPLKGALIDPLIDLERLTRVFVLVKD